MMEAIHLAKLGPRVVILEERQELGGAWYSTEH
jgi:cation diffusion facilitator CzcD-associated flavoprotein CzcO